MKILTVLVSIFFLSAGAFALTFEAPEGMAVQGVPEKIEIAHSGETVRLSLEAIRAA